jgi:cell division protein FtsW (lipid II flippase)
VLLVAVMFTEPIHGATRWFRLGPVGVQPSELAKIGYILMLAWYLRHGDRYRKLSGLIVPFALSFLPMLLILVEPDLGTSLLFLPTLYFMLFMAGAKLRHLLLILALGAAAVLLPVPKRVAPETFQRQQQAYAARDVGPVTFYTRTAEAKKLRGQDLPVAYCRVGAGGGVYDIQPLSLWAMRGHQMDRIKGWLRQDDDALAAREGFQLRWSLVTLASGGLAGSGRASAGEDASRGDMYVLALQQLPFYWTDFIFSVIGGRWGLLGCLCVLALYGVIFVFGLEISTITDDPFGRLLAVGIVGLLLSQVLINVGMTMGLMPITGMTLPMVSYGGSSLVASCAALGLLVNVARRRAIFLSRRPFDYAEKRQRQVNIESASTLAARGPADDARPARHADRRELHTIP